jgi:ribosomal protein L37AE/L43A
MGTVRQDEKVRSGKRRRCPACGELALVPILYGPLPESLSADRERGDLVWGGMVRRKHSPRWKCHACEKSFPDSAV